ncbi:hypothetical protein [Isachenkonia alkalipeptolytica]|uniref:Uncharacterized protein n=1 Tax=Isachenkonia alkalipeptolytica TaxID=2565777 RepID=A0AA44BDB9_9CLOT|nr:hypothetical protein [Isachenkonia alkalipeptolytica]NBG87792.1 hypothetical protein [Isachenkonia alkalipeptolytica]
MKEKNDFEKDMENLEDWQEKQYSPGHYIGTGKVPRPILAVSKHPKLLIVAGAIGLLLPMAALIFGDVLFREIAFLFFVPLVFLIGGILRIRGR